MVSTWKMHQNEYKQAYVWSSGSWDNLWYFKYLVIFHVQTEVYYLCRVDSGALITAEFDGDVLHVNVAKHSSMCFRCTCRSGLGQYGEELFNIVLKGSSCCLETYIINDLRVKNLVFFSVNTCGKCVRILLWITDWFFRYQIKWTHFCVTHEMFWRTQNCDWPVLFMFCLLCSCVAFCFCLFVCCLFIDPLFCFVFEIKWSFDEFRRKNAVSSSYVL